MKARKLMLMGAAAILTAIAPFARCAAQSAPSKAERQAMFLRGAELWPVYCNTCHNARPSSEFSPAEWNMILMHMRTQANLPARDARAILEFLKSSH
jgi:mono/diheme cytochrome c family protein